MKCSTLAVIGSLWLVGCGPTKDTAEATDTGSIHQCESNTATTTWEDNTLHHDKPHCASLELSTKIIGEGELSVEFVEADGAWVPHITATTDAVFDGLVLSGEYEQAGNTDSVLWRQGYQSWSYSGVTPLSTLTLDDDGVPLTGGDGDAITVKDELDGTSWWVGAVGRADGAAILLGAVGALKTRFFVAFDDNQAWAVWGHRGDQIQLDAGQTIVLDPLWIGSGSDAQALYEEYAHTTSMKHPPRGLERRPPSGWATWYHFFEDISELEVRENLAYAQSIESSEEVESLAIFQIDDGWQRLWGDWTAGDDFPSGMPTLAADIAAAGFTPGLWMAPFYVDRSTDTYTSNPDWWVQQPNGEEIRFTNLNTGDYALLDVTHPDAAVWLSNEIESKVSQGWVYLKL
ncbi:MAG: alpha-galactosidase, partial [Myxococcota bacterium]